MKTKITPKNIILKTGLIFLWVVSVIIALLIFMQTALWSPAGKKFVKSLIPTQVAGISYELVIDTKNLPHFLSFSITAPDLKINGSCFHKNGILTAELSGTLASLRNYSRFTGSEHNLEKLSFNAKIKQNGYAEFNGTAKQYTNNKLYVSAQDIAFNGKYENQTLTINSLTAGKIDVTIPENISGNSPQLNVSIKGSAAQKSDMDNIKLDIHVDIPKKIMVRGWGLDAEFGGKLDIKGTAQKPLFYGELKVLRGRYSEFGRVFKFTKAEMNFAGSVPPEPVLDIAAQTKAGEITAIVTITGSVMSPGIGFSSDPSLPEDEVLSYILFGEGMESLSPFQALQLAKTLGRFSGQGGGLSKIPDPITALRNATGLDDLHVETDEQGGASVGAGKYLTDKVYLEFESGTEEDSGAASVQVELTPNITLESEVGQDASGGVGIFWKRDY